MGYRKKIASLVVFSGATALALGGCVARTVESSSAETGSTQEGLSSQETRGTDNQATPVDEARSADVAEEYPVPPPYGYPPRPHCWRFYRCLRFSSYETCRYWFPWLAYQCGPGAYPPPYPTPYPYPYQPEPEPVPSPTPL